MYFTHIRYGFPVSVKRADSARDEKDQKGAAAKSHWPTGPTGATEIESGCQPGRSGRANGGAGNCARPLCDFSNRKPLTVCDGLRSCCARPRLENFSRLALRRGDPSLTRQDARAICFASCAVCRRLPGNINSHRCKQRQIRTPAAAQARDDSRASWRKGRRFAPRWKHRRGRRGAQTDLRQGVR